MVYNALKVLQLCANNFMPGTGAKNDKMKVDGFYWILSSRDIGGRFYRGDAGNRVYS